MLIIIGGLVLGWMRSNNFQTLGDVINHFRIRSADADRAANQLAEEGIPIEDINIDLNLEALGIREIDTSWIQNLPGTDYEIHAPNNNSQNENSSENLSNEGKEESNSDTNGGEITTDNDSDGLFDNLPNFLRPPGSNTQAPDESLPASQIIRTLNGLTVNSGSRNSLNAEDFAHWITPDGAQCNMRVQILKRDAIYFQTSENNPCLIESGLWVDPLSGAEIESASDMSIMHVVPLSLANNHGAANLSSADKVRFANDANNLLAVSSRTLSSRNDRSPRNWMPSDNFDGFERARCIYSVIFVNVLDNYDLTLARQDQTALRNALEAC